MMMARSVPFEPIFVVEMPSGSSVLSMFMLLFLE
jgi:hypothetical protein